MEQSTNQVIELQAQERLSEIEAEIKAYRKVKLKLDMYIMDLQQEKEKLVNLVMALRIHEELENECEPHKTKFYVYHPIDGSLNHDCKENAFEYVYVACIEATKLSEVFMKSQNDFNDEYARLGIRSTSVGDLIKPQDATNPYIIMGTSYREVSHTWFSFRDWSKHTDDVHALAAYTTFKNTPESDRETLVWHTVEYTVGDGRGERVGRTAYIKALDPSHAIKEVNLMGEYQLRILSNKPINSVINLNQE